MTVQNLPVAGVPTPPPCSSVVSTVQSGAFSLKDCSLYDSFLASLVVSYPSFVHSSFSLWLNDHWDDFPYTGIKGSLHQSYSFWVSIGAHPFLLDVIQSGYRIPFRSVPPPLLRPNNRSALEHNDFVYDSLGELFRNGWARLVPEPPHCVSPLQVAIQPNGKKRLILDLTHVNQYVWKQTFKMEGLSQAASYFIPDGWAFSYDITKSFYHMDVHPDSQDYLGFSFKFDGHTYFGVFTVCCFGLCSAPWLLTKLLKPLLTRWRSLGLYHFIYLDDGIGFHASYDGCAAAAARVRSELSRAGFHEQLEKCNWAPTQQLSWLGFSLDFAMFSVSIPPAKYEKALLAICFERAAHQTTCRRVQRVAGLISCLAIVLGPIALIGTKAFNVFTERVLTSGARYDHHVTISPDLRWALNFWWDLFPSMSLSRSLVRPLPAVLCCSDASAVGGAAFVARLSGADKQTLAAHAVGLFGRCAPQPGGGISLSPLDSAHVASDSPCDGPDSVSVATLPHLDPGVAHSAQCNHIRQIVIPPDRPPDAHMCLTRWTAA